MRWILRGAIGLALLAAAAAVAAVVLASATDFNAYRDEIAAAIKKQTGRDVRIGGEIEQNVLTLSPSISLAGLSVANAGRGSRPRMLTAERIELEVALLPLIGGEIRVKRFRLTGADLLLETDAGGTPNWLFAQAGGKKPGKASGAGGDKAGAAASAIPFVRNLAIRDSVVTFRDGRSGLETRLRIDEVAAQAPTFESAINVRARGTYNGVAVAADGKLGQLANLFARVANFPVAANLQFGRSSMAIAGNADLSGALPGVAGEIKADLLDLDEIAAATGRGRGGTAPTAGAETSKSGAAGKDRQSRLFPRDELPLGILGLFDGRLKVRIERLVVARSAFDAVRADILLRSGRMAVRKFRSRLARGRLTGTASLDIGSRRPQFAADLQASGISSGDVLHRLTGEPLVRAPVAIRARISGAGRSAHAIASTLKGPVALTMGEGPVANRLFEVATTDLLTLLAQKRGRLRVVCGVFAFRFDGRGVARGRQLILDTNRVTFYGQGAVNLRRESLDFQFVPAGKGISLARFASILPISIAGSLTRPAVAIEAAAIPERVASELLGIVTRPLEAVRGKKEAQRGCGARRAAAGPAPKKKPAAERKSGTGLLLDDLKKLNPFRE